MLYGSQVDEAMPQELDSLRHCQMQIHLLSDISAWHALRALLALQGLSIKSYKCILRDKSSTAEREGSSPNKEG